MKTLLILFCLSQSACVPMALYNMTTDNGAQRAVDSDCERDKNLCGKTYSRF